MSKKILVCTDGSELSQKGVAYGLQLAKSLSADAVLLTVTEPYPYPPSAGIEVYVPMPVDMSAYESGQKKSADAILAAALEKAREIGVDAKPVHIPDAFPAEAIVEVAKGEGCEMIVMSSHGRRGLRRLLLGSQTFEVLSSSTVPVLVVR